MDIFLLRKKINEIDKNIIQLLAKRQIMCQHISKVKKTLCKPVFQGKREKKIFQRYKKLSEHYCLSWSLVQKLFKTIIKESRQIQKPR